MPTILRANAKDVAVIPVIQLAITGLLKSTSCFLNTL